jgi:hypothetical protein
MQNYILHFFFLKKKWYGIDFPDLYGRKSMIFEKKKEKKKRKNENGTGNAIEVKDRKQYWKCQSFAQI